MEKLAQLHAEIDLRVQAIRENLPDWPCAKGCDNCCRRLAEIPTLTATEWELLREGLTALPPERLRQIEHNMHALADGQSRPITCPLLDQNTGSCPVYAQRPVACRTYGFYVQRTHGLYCHDIESRVSSGDMAEVIWGNHEAIDTRLSEQGETRTLTAWFARWKNEI